MTKRKKRGRARFTNPRKRYPTLEAAETAKQRSASAMQYLQDNEAEADRIRDMPLDEWLAEHGIEIEAPNPFRQRANRESQIERRIAKLERRVARLSRENLRLIEALILPEESE